MKKCVEITIDTETGNLHVMECAPKVGMGDEGWADGEASPMMEGGEGGEMDGMDESSPMGSGKMQDFQDMDSALQYVAELLTGETRESPESAMQSAQKGYGTKPRMGNGRPSMGQVFGGE